MSRRRPIQSRADRAKAAAAAICVNLFLGLALITGLSLRDERRREEILETFDVTLPPPPPQPAVVESQPQNDAKRESEGARGKKAEPSPVVAPASPILRSTPVIAAPTAGTGSAPSAGNADRGTGTGSGGSGSGSGAGGTGAGAGRTAASLISGRITNRDYRAIAGRDIEEGTAVFTLLVDTDGRVARCRAATSSGSARIDATLCDMLTKRLRFRPAREADGTLLFQDVNYVARWGR